MRARTVLINTARGLTKSFGQRLRGWRGPSGADIGGRGEPGDPGCGGPLLAEVETLNQRIAAYDRQIEQLAKERYPEVFRLKQVKGVGTLIALTFVLTVDDPNRFQRSRDVGCYMGLRPDVETPARVSRSCTSAKKATATCEACWCKEPTTFWVPLASIVICAAGV